MPKAIKKALKRGGGGKRMSTKRFGGASKRMGRTGTPSVGKKR